CVEEERQVGQDNCVSYRTLKLQIPESPMRPHFVKARVRCMSIPTAPTPPFTGQDASAATTRKAGSGRPMTLDAPLKSAQQRADPVDMWTALRPAHIPTGEQNQKKRTNHVLPKPDNFIRYPQRLPDEQFLFLRVTS